MKTNLKFFLISVFYLFFTLFVVKDVQALTTYHYSDTATEHALIVANGLCDLSDKCTGAPSACFNNESIGVTNCGEACKGGGTWSKYAYDNCYNGERFGECVAEYQYNDRVCSTGDKCLAGETGLRAGSCTCGVYGASTYKYCCSATGVAEACTAAGVLQDPYPPPEGQCPGGYIIDGTRVRSSNCTPLVSCAPDTSNPPNPYTQCGQTGGCTNNYAANHTVSITRNLCTDTTFTYSCTDQGIIPGQCTTPPPPPSSSTRRRRSLW